MVENLLQATPEVFSNVVFFLLSHQIVWQTNICGNFLIAQLQQVFSANYQQ